MEPRVSILLPVRDAAATLPACLASLRRQREARFDCVVADDGSRDGSLALAEKTAAEDPRFRVLAGPRRGLVPTLRRGLTACRAPLVARIDADDWMHRDRLALQCAELDASPGLAAVGSHVRCFPRRDLGPGLRAYEAWLHSIDSPRRVFEERFVECPVAHPTLLVRRDVLRRFDYRDAGWPEDYDLLLRLLDAGLRVGVVPHRLVGWRHTAGRHSRTSPTYDPLRFTACKAHFLARGFLSGATRYDLWGYGGTGRALVRALRGEGREPARIVELHPGRIGRTIQGAPVIARHALGPPGRRPLLVSVAGAAARTRIRRELARLGYRECVDYVCAA
ncbi:MAG: glycosyltransferase family 2 protein [Myxococcota bacterium]